MRFSNWPALLLLIVIPILHRWWRARNKPAAVMFSIPVAKSASGWNPLTALMIIKYIAVMFLVIAAARPQASFHKNERNVNGIDIMMVMDVSASMTIEDLADRPRIDIAKETMKHFIEGRSNDRIGFVAFSGEPITLVPPTLDYGLLLKALKDAEIGVLKDGTAIGDGLSLAVSRLRSSKAKSRVIILLTDGDSNVGQVDPGTAGDIAAGYDIRVYTIAIGREGRVQMPIRQKGAFGQTITRYQIFENALNPQLLEQIASVTKGRFYRVTEVGALESVFAEIDRLEKSDFKTTDKVLYTDLFQKPLKLGAVLLVFEQLLAQTWWRIIP